MRPSIYKLTHEYSEGDSKIYFKTTMKREKLLKLIHAWQLKLAEIDETMGFDEEQMMEILECFGCQRILESDDFRSYGVLDLYLIWEAVNIKVTADEMNNPDFNNEKAQKVLDIIIKE